MGKTKKKIIAIDFDGFIVENKYPKIGKPKIDIIYLIKSLKASGKFILILWTCRQGSKLDEAIKYCKDIGIEFDYINDNTKENIKKYGFNSRKIYADYYLDDKNGCFMMPEGYQLLDHKILFLIVKNNYYSS